MFIVHTNMCMYTPCDSVNICFVFIIEATQKWHLVKRFFLVDNIATPGL
jgi:hypothetical protein